MDGIRYLCSRKGRYYFRRRVPGFSTCLAPVMVALGTTDHTAGFKLCVQLTAHMDRMLDENTYTALSEEDVAAFFKVELCAYLARLRKVRLVERMDGSLTAEKARRNHLEAIVLRGLVEDGLREEMDTSRLNTLVALINHARMERNIAEFTPNLSGLIPRDTRTSAEKREVFTFDDMQRVFAHSVRQGSKTRGRRHIAGNRVIKDHHYWISLLIAYTGARRSEIAGLLTTEVGSEDGIPFVSIQVNHLRGLKNSASKRRLPLHAHLMELGFLEFVEESRKRKKLALFEEAVPAQLRHLAHVKDANFAAYDKKFGDALDHMFRTSLEHSLDGNPRGLSCHGMRHYVNDFLINLRNPDGTTQVIPEMDRLDILGHASRSENSRTYRRAERPLGPLHAAIKQLPYLFGGA